MCDTECLEKEKRFYYLPAGNFNKYSMLSSKIMNEQMQININNWCIGFVSFMLDPLDDTPNVCYIHYLIFLMKLP